MSAQYLSASTQVPKIWVQNWSKQNKVVFKAENIEGTQSRLDKL